VRLLIERIDMAASTKRIMQYTRGESNDPPRRSAVWCDSLTHGRQRVE
jgi:hypothetical protein